MRYKLTSCAKSGESGVGVGANRGTVNFGARTPTYYVYKAQRTIVAGTTSKSREKNVHKE